MSALAEVLDVVTPDSRGRFIEEVGKKDRQVQRLSSEISHQLQVLNE